LLGILKQRHFVSCCKYKYICDEFFVDLSELNNEQIYNELHIYYSVSKEIIGQRGSNARLNINF